LGVGFAGRDFRSKGKLVGTKDLDTLLDRSLSTAQCAAAHFRLEISFNSTLQIIQMRNNSVAKYVREHLDFIVSIGT